jgi:ribosomal protein L31E
MSDDDHDNRDYILSLRRVTREKWEAASAAASMDTIKRHAARIAQGDLDGAALALIKELRERVDELETKVKRLEAR